MNLLRPNFFLGVACGLMLAAAVLITIPVKPKTAEPSTEEIIAAARQQGMVFPREIPRVNTVTPSPTSAATLTIPKGATAEEIALLLGESKTIDNPALFLARVQERAATALLKPGTYLFTGQPDLDELIDQLITGP